MPVDVKKLDHKYRVSTPGGIKAKGTTKTKAYRQARLLRAVDHGWKPTGKPAAEDLTNKLLAGIGTAKKILEAEHLPGQSLPANIGEPGGMPGLTLELFKKYKDAEARHADAILSGNDSEIGATLADLEQAFKTYRDSFAASRAKKDEEFQQEG